MVNTAKDGLVWALEIIDSKTGFQDMKEHRGYVEKIKEAIQEAIDWNGDGY